MHNLQDASESRERGQAAAPVETGVTLLAPVWGERHIDRFLDIVLPSWLAPGNIPALAQQGPAIVRIMTRGEDIERLERASGIKALRKTASVIFTTIDDLLAPDCVPVTLTLAFHRGVAAGVTPGRPSSFLLLNADFVLSDGAISHAARQFANGARLLLAPTLRVTEEQMRPALRARIDGGVIALSGPELTKLALPCLHPTVLASQMDQAWLKCRHTHQLCWRADQDTILARGFCLFALGISTTEPPAQATAFCDYGMGRLMTEGAAPVVMDHSDRFLALEVAPRDYESTLVAFGPPDLSEIATQLGQWATDFNREQAKTPLVFTARAGGKPSAHDLATADAAVADLSARLGPAPDLQRHPNWIGALDGWMRSREEVGLVGVPLELQADDPAAREARGEAEVGLRKVARSVLVGSNDRRPWQPFHALSRRLAALVEETQQAGKRAAAIGATRLFSFEPLKGLSRDPSGPAPDLLIVGLDLTNWASVQAFVADAAANAAPGQEIVLLLTQRLPRPLSPMDVARIRSLLDLRIETRSVEFFDIRADSRAERAYGRLSEADPRERPLEALGRVLVAPLHMLALLGKNAMALAGAGSVEGAEAALLIGVAKPGKDTSAKEMGGP